MASFVTTDGSSFELAETETLLGRGGREFNDPPKLDVGPLRGGPTVSRRHARVYRRAGQWYLRVEPEARNPTLVGGRRIPGGEEAPLSDDTRVQIGDVVLVFRAPAEAPRQSADVTMMEGDGTEGNGTEGDGRAAAPPPIATPIATPIVASAPAPEPPTATVAPTAQSAPAAPAPAPRSKPAPVSPARPPAVATWPSRLGGRPATLAALGGAELKRVNPFRGLMIDESTWADAHDYHRTQARLHLLSAHGWGVVEGLEVLADPEVPGTILVRPGVAVDSLGRALFVPQERRLPVAEGGAGARYVVLRLREELAAPQRFWNDLDEYTRVVEKCEVVLEETPPSAPAMELARVALAGPVRNAPDPLDPREGEIDLRFRERLLVRPRPEIAVAQLVPSGGDAAWASTHRLGLRYLLREIGQTTSYRPRWLGSFRLGDPLPAASLLYLAGPGAFAVGEGVDQLRGFLQGGGVLLADGCREGKLAEFAASVEGLAGALRLELRPVGRWHPALAARHLFAEPPLVGPEGARLVEGGGLMLSTADYGCAWQGGAQARPLGREAIRSALELGVNVAVYARQRQRPLEIIDFEA